MGILKRTSPWEHSYQTMWRREQKFLSDYRTTRPDMLCSLLEERVPSGLTEALHQAFFRAFSLLFEKGEGIVRWAGRQQRREEAYQVRRFAADLREDRRSLRAFSKAADRAGQGSVVQAGVQGVGLGLLGIGLPDIPLFTLTLLKTIRETAVSFGFAGTETDEQVWILRLIEASLSSGTELEERNRMLNQFIQEGAWPDSPVLEQQMRQTAHMLSQSMLYWKVVQGIPLVGAVGGAWDAVCLRRVQRYAAIKYSRRFLIDRKLGRQARENAR